MNTKIFEYILAVAEERSVSRAAERYYLSQADLSRHLKTVESKLGVPLFTRSASGMRLTEAGIIFVNDARTILHLEKELEQNIAMLRRQSRHVIRLMLDFHFQNRFYRKIQPLFQAAHPDIELDITICNFLQARRAIIDGDADLAIFDTPAPSSAELEYTVFSKQDMKLLFPKEYSGKTDIDGLRHAVEENDYFMMLYPIGTTARFMQEQALAANQIFPKTVLEGGVQNSITQIEHGSTCGILPEVFCTPELRDKVVVGDTLFCAYSVMAHLPSKLPSVQTQDLMRMVIQTLLK